MRNFDFVADKQKALSECVEGKTKGTEKNQRPNITSVGTNSFLISAW